MPSYKLTCFDAQGHADSVRLALHVAGIPFTDERWTPEQFLQKRDVLPFGHLPLLTIDDKTVIPHETSILRYIGRAAGLYPADREEALEVDILLDTAGDFVATWMVFVAPDFADNIEAKKKVTEEITPQMLKCLEKRLAAKSTTFSAANKLTLADIRLYAVISVYKAGTFGFPKDLIDKYPHISKLFQTIGSHEKVASWSKN